MTNTTRMLCIRRRMMNTDIGALWLRWRRKRERRVPGGRHAPFH